MKLSHFGLLAALIAMLLVFAAPAGASSKISVGDRALTLKWSAVKGASGYRVSWRSRALKAGKPTAAWSKKWLGLKVLKASKRSYKATGLINGAKYQIRLESKAKKSPWTVKSTLTATPNASPPDPPTNVTGVAGDGQVTVSWKDPSNNGGSVITSYRVNASGEGGQSCTAQGQAATTCTVTGLANGTSYTFIVTAISGVGERPSVASAPVTPLSLPGSLPPATTPGAPTSPLASSVGQGRVTVSWTAPASDGGSAITGYTARASGDSSQACATNGALSCTVAGLANGTAYTFTVVATNAIGNSGVSAASGTVTPASCATGGVCVVGDSGPGGGTVFYAPGAAFTEAGTSCFESCLYLEVAPAPGWSSGGVDPEYQWGGGNGTVLGSCSNWNISGATGTAIGSGFANTAALITACPDSNGNGSAPAARAAWTYLPTVGGVSIPGWFLPSKDEAMELDKSDVGGVGKVGNDYWTSSQVGTPSFEANYAWEQWIGFLTYSLADHKQQSFHVRPIRAF